MTALTALGELPAQVGWPAVAIGVAGALAPVLMQPFPQWLNLRTETEHSRNAALDGLYRTGAIVEIPVQQADPARLGIHPAWKLPGKSRKMKSNRFTGWQPRWATQRQCAR